jgi:putative SOS response-associated peptidase YedK
MRRVSPLQPNVPCVLPQDVINDPGSYVPASGFYEWQATGEKGKQPFYIHAETGEYLPFAGLYDIWKNPEGREIYSFTIITTQSTVNLQSIHNRMPVILEPAAEEVWLNPDVTDPQELTPSYIRIRYSRWIFTRCRRR